MSNSNLTKHLLTECENCPTKPGCPSGCYHTNRTVTGNPLKAPAAFCAMRRGALEVALEIDRRIGHIYPDWWEGQKSKRRTVMPQLNTKQLRNLLSIGLNAIQLALELLGEENNRPQQQTPAQRPQQPQQTQDRSNIANT